MAVKKGSGQKVTTTSRPTTRPDVHKHGYAPPPPATQKPAPKKK